MKTQTMEEYILQFAEAKNLKDFFEYLELKIHMKEKTFKAFKTSYLEDLDFEKEAKKIQNLALKFKNMKRPECGKYKVLCAIMAIKNRVERKMRKL